ncbi:MAG: class I SAM-dependent methyltransferase [Rhodocyclaceae bacterium]|nr:class I SAM-dependent methyltransferase [Rhodocyclaceae bacterium]MBX3667514.1 class I SAM-dependent methyltransferase [Rhodocyclaceae bacterium]
MTNRSISLDERLYDYLTAHSLREHPVLRELRAATATLPFSRWQISPEQGQFMALLVQLSGARRALEIGTYTGYSALAVALALPADGRLITCDIDAETTAIAAQHWQRAGVAHKVDLRLAPAADTLDALLGAGKAGTFDFAFIDADKENYRNYYECCLALLRPGGLIAVDNTLWSGRVADPANVEPDTLSLREFNALLHGDVRVSLSLVPIGDGLTLAHKL